MDHPDERFMRRALELAAKAPWTSPNPRVGAVTVRDGRIVGEGTHLGPGHPHAETEALAAADCRGATCYVTLEPCLHHGRTPPCAPALVEAGIARVVVGTEDPDPRVNGRGLEFLGGAGIEVVSGVLRDEAAELNAAFIHQRTTGRPVVTLKLALTLDGRLAAPDGTSRWITGQSARRHVHARRLEADAVMVGAGTVTADDPSLTVRAVEATRQPARVILDSSGRVPPTAKVFAPGADVIVATTDRSSHERQTEWKEAGAEVLVVPADRAGCDLGAVVDALATRGWLEIYCEGGAGLATSLIEKARADRLELYYGPVIAGAGGPEIGATGIGTLDEAPRWSVVRTEAIGEDVFVRLTRTTS